MKDFEKEWFEQFDKPCNAKIVPIMKHPQDPNGTEHLQNEDCEKLGCKPIDKES